MKKEDLHGTLSVPSYLDLSLLVELDLPSFALLHALLERCRKGFDSKRLTRGRRENDSGGGWIDRMWSVGTFLFYQQKKNRWSSG